LQPTRPIVLISCVKSKRPFRCAAKELYCSNLFQAQREFAEALARRWFILSAKYGLVSPDQDIEPYEKTMNGASAAEKKAWSEKVLIDLEGKLGPSDRLVITAGENYCRYLIPLLEAKGHEVEQPLKGLSMGYRPGRLRKLAAQARRIGPK
jgi:hypothetical protein